MDNVESIRSFSAAQRLPLRCLLDDAFASYFWMRGVGTLPSRGEGASTLWGFHPNGGSTPFRSLALSTFQALKSRSSTLPLSNVRALDSNLDSVAGAATGDSVATSG